MPSKAQQLGQYLLTKTLDRASGRNKGYCVGERPEDKFYISNIAPEYGRESEEDFEAKTKPVSHGLDCKPTSETTGTLKITFDLYYPSFPTYEEFKSLRKKGLRAAKLEVAEREDIAIESVDRDAVSADSLYSIAEEFYRKFSVSLSFAR